MLSLLFLIACLFYGCATVETSSSHVRVPERKGVYHKVRTAETLWRIAKTYNIDISDIISANKIPNAAQIEKGQLIFIPGADTTREVPVEKDIHKSAEFAWPLRGEIVSYFGGQKNARINHGIDIRVKPGEAVAAARDGRVVFADYLNGYGYTVILDHEDNYFTIYSQNSDLLVKLGDLVAQGSLLARADSRQELSLLHFEIRKKAKADNPLYYLP